MLCFSSYVLPLALNENVSRRIENIVWGEKEVAV